MHACAQARARVLHKLTGACMHACMQVIDELFGAITAGTPFYVICADGETTRAMDDGRMQWAMDDRVFRRAPLSRWSAEYKEEYARVAKGF